MFETVTNPWEVEEAGFPAGAGPGVKWRFLLSYAVLAPSSHNTQPWRFTVHGDTVELHADRSRTLSFVDPEQRALVISCGAALFHARLALWHFGYNDEVELFPDEENPDLLARVRMGDTRIATAEEHQLFKAIPHRHTYRAAFEDRPVPASVRTDLQLAALSEGAWLNPVDDGARHAVATLIAEGAREQWHDPQFRNELAAWIHPETARDGLGGFGFGLTPLVIRSFDLGNRTASHDQRLAEDAPLLAVLGTPGDTKVDWLQAGQALARVLLLADVNDLSASFLNQPIEVPRLRTELQTIVGRSGYPQLLLRMGTGSGAHATPRRMVIEVVN